MNFWVVICAFALNMAVGGFFKPYTVWITRLHTNTARRFASKKHKLAVRYGCVIALTGIIAIWFVVDHLIMLLEYQSAIYSYIAYGCVIFFCVCCGQTAGIIKKFSGNTENTVYIKQLFGYMLVPEAERAEKSNSKKLFVYASAKLLAEKIITPFMLVFLFGAGSAVAYSFVNHLANSDNSSEMSTHGYSAAAIKINQIVSLPSYAMLSLLLWAVKWILNFRFRFKDVKLRERCAKQLYAFENERYLTESFVKRTCVTVYACTVMMLLVFASIYIFIQASLAAFGLDEYWDFWSGKNIPKE